MLEINRTSTSSSNLFTKAKHLVTGLVLGGTILLWSQAAPAASVVSSLGYSMQAFMTNSAVEPKARGAVRATVTRRGAVDSQRLTVALTKLIPSTTYHLVAFLNDSATSTNVADFTTDRRGSSAITYVQGTHPGTHPLPAAADPITDIRELEVLNTNGEIVLGSDLTSPHSFSYAVKLVKDNTGAIGNANGVLLLRGNPHLTSASVTATGLTPLTPYQLTVNGVGFTTKTSDRLGKVTVAGPKTGMPLVLDIRTVALADSTGTIVLVINGLGVATGTNTDVGVVVGPSPLALGAAANFAVLAGSTVTSAGATTVNGDLGVGPGTAVTGFPPGIVNGTTHAGDTTAAQAQLDLTTAFNDAAGRTVGPVAVAGNLGGQTLAPGLYKSTTSLEISSGDLTLDAQGNPNAVWIFQIASTLTTTSGRQVILSGGAKAANIFWQVGSSATLGTTSVFKGTIMADQSITLTTGATLEGRALARIAAVTMDASTVTIPVP